MLRPGCAWAPGPSNASFAARRPSVGTARAGPHYWACLCTFPRSFVRTMRRKPDPYRRDARRPYPHSAQRLAASSRARLERELAGQSFSNRGGLRLLCVVCHLPRALGTDLALRADRRPHHDRAAGRRVRLGLPAEAYNLVIGQVPPCRSLRQVARLELCRQSSLFRFGV